MTKISELEKMDFDKFKKPKDRELVFVPKDEFLEWYKRSKSVEADIEWLKLKLIIMNVLTVKAVWKDMN